MTQISTSNIMTEELLAMDELPEDQQMSDDFRIYVTPNNEYYAIRDRHSSENGFSFCISAGSKMRVVSEAVSLIEAYVIKQEEENKDKE